MSSERRKKISYHYKRDDRLNQPNKLNTSNTMVAPAKDYICCSVTQSCPTLATPGTVAHQALLSMGILQARTLEWVGKWTLTSSEPHYFIGQPQPCELMTAGRVGSFESGVQ